MKDEITVTFKRCKEGEPYDKPVLVIYWDGVSDSIYADTYIVLGEFFDSGDLWYTELSNFEEKPKTAEEYVDEYKRGGSLINLEEFAEMILNQERGNDDK